MKEEQYNMENIETIKNDTIALIDRLKAITFNAGLAGGGNEYIILVETFLYKFLNDKFIFEAKRWRPELKEAEDEQAFFEKMSDDDYDAMCDCMEDVVELRRTHLISYLAKFRNEPNFATLFDAALEDIAKSNQTIFFIQNSDKTTEPILRPIAELINGGTSKKNAFCKSLIEAVAQFSFESAFSCGYDFFSTIFEYLIKDYNANGGGTYAEYYTPHAVAEIMAKLLVSPDEDVHSVSCYDPSAGTGTLVIALAHAIGANNCTVYTQDISDKSSTMLMLNMILNGFAHSLSHVVHGNTLTEPFHKSEKDQNSLRKFNYIVSNPPFKLDFSDYQSDLKADPYKGRFFAGIPNIPNKDRKKMEIYLCFFQHLLYSLKEDGKAAIVVPTGFITSKTGIAKKIIEHIVDNGWCGGVVSMPSNIFANTGTNVSVVIIDKKKKHNETVLIDASKLGEDYQEAGLKKHRLTSEEIQYIVDTFRNREKHNDFSVVVSKEEIKEKSYSLSAGQYFDIKIEYVDITEEEFNKRVADYETTLKKQFEESHQLEADILKHLQNIKFNG